MRHLRLNDFTGGQNTVLAPDRIADNQAVLLENVDLADGTLKSLPYVTAVDDTFYNASPPFTNITLAGNGKVTGHTGAGDLLRCTGRTFRLSRSGDLRLLDEDTHADEGRTGAPYLNTARILTLTSEFRLALKITDRDNSVLLPVNFSTHACRLRLITQTAGLLDGVRVGDWIGFHQRSESAPPAPDPPQSQILAVGPVETVLNYIPTSVVLGDARLVWDLAYSVELLLDTRSASAEAAPGGLRPFYCGPIDDVAPTHAAGKDWFTPTYAARDTKTQWQGMEDVVFAATSYINVGNIAMVIPEVFVFSTGTMNTDQSVSYSLRSAPPYARVWEANSPGLLIGTVDKEQGENFYTALEADGEYRYAVTIDYRDGLETAPFPPGTATGPAVKIVGGFAWQDVEQPAEDPTWFPRIIARRYVVKVDFAPGFLDEADSESRYGLPQPLAVNLYRTVKDGAEYWLVKTWDLTQADYDYTAVPTTFYDDVRDATILQQGNLQALDSYPPLLVLNDAGWYEYATGTMYGAEREGILWIASGRHLRFSKPGSPEEFPLSNGHDFHTDIEAISTMGPMTVCWMKDGTVYRVGGASVDDLEVQQADGSLRCLKHECVTEYRGRLLFPTTDGLAEFDGVSARLLSQEPAWNGLKFAVVHANRYLIFQTDGGYIIEPGFYMQRGASTPGWQVSMFTDISEYNTFNSGVSDSGTGLLFLGTNYQLTTWATYSTLQRSQIISRVIDLGSTSSPAHLSQIWCDLTGDWRVRLVLDGQTVFDQTYSTGAKRQAIPARIQSGARGRKLQVLLDGKGTIEDLEISYAAMGTSPRRGDLA